jgi:phosphatidylglycerophosphatase C
MTQTAENQEPRPVAFFDFDGTLTRGDTLLPFLRYVVGAPNYYVKLALVSPVLAAYFVKILRNDTAKQIVLKQFLAGYQIDELFELGQRFSEKVIPTMLRSEGMERLRWHQEQGHECVLVSASLDLYLRAWSTSNCFSDLICTSLSEEKKETVTGKIKGKNCHGTEKLRRILAWQSSRKTRQVYAYGDTSGDGPMLKMATYGYIRKGKKFVNVNRVTGRKNESLK